MKDATLCFLIKEGKGGKLSKVLLAMKKRGFGANRWNGVGGKIDFKGGESTEDALKRETFEEIGVKIKEFHKVAELNFEFKLTPKFDQLVHTYFASEWEGEPIESEEMKPKWFKLTEIPYKDMWPDDIFWVPKVLAQKLLKAKFLFGKNDRVLEKEIKLISSFN